MNRLKLAAFAVLTSLAMVGSLRAEEGLIVSSTVKGEGVIDLFPKAEERQKAIAWFKKHGITRVYVETFRHGRFAEEALLRTVKQEFEAAGLEIYGAICPTTAKIKSLFECATNTVDHAKMAEVSRHTAKIFDRIILDDFLFSRCTCKGCKELKGNRSWGDFRTAFKFDLDRKCILEPAKAVNPDVKIFIKYPLWYEGFHGAGYDVVRETELFGQCWIGTETREPDRIERIPQTQASWIYGWALDFSKGACGGAWFDPLNAKPESYVEQARESILGGATEILLHAYDYLGTDSIGIAFHGDGKVPWGKADAEAFRQEKEGIHELFRLVRGKTKEGVLCVKRPNVDVHDDRAINSFIGMLGVPVLPGAALKDATADFLSTCTGNAETLRARIRENRKAGRPTLLTRNALKVLGEDAQKELGVTAEWFARERPRTFLEKVDDTLFVLGNDSNQKSRWTLMDLPLADLNAARAALMKPFGLTLEAPTRVALHLYRGEKGERLAVLENFNNKEVTVTLNDAASGAWSAALALPRKDSARLVEATSGRVRVTLSPRSLIVLQQN